LWFTSGKGYLQVRPYWGWNVNYISKCVIYCIDVKTILIFTLGGCSPIFCNLSVPWWRGQKQIFFNLFSVLQYYCYLEWYFPIQVSIALKWDILQVSKKSNGDLVCENLIWYSFQNCPRIVPKYSCIVSINPYIGKIWWCWEH
jgi:hypothetical protein